MITGQSNEFRQLSHIFEHSVDLHHDNIALICNNALFSYQELESAANQLAHYLVNKGYGQNKKIGVLLERQAQSYISMLAVIKSAALYVPIEIDYPDDRINYIIEDMDFDAIITTSSQKTRTNIEFPSVILLDKEQHKIAKEPNTRLQEAAETSSQNSCYVIYTSGSTGKPKGVEVSNASICHYVTVASRLYNMSSHDVIYQGFSLAFDASFEEVWMAFANGGTLVACTDKEIRSGLGLIEFLTQHQVTVFSTVPTLLATLDGPNLHLRLLILGGEACSMQLVKPWMRNNLRILNTYGPTEATVVATCAECIDGEPITIGYPLPGYEVYILDAQFEPVTTGEVGELCIGGPALAKGYINRADLTDAKFIMDNTGKKRLYRTGDLAQITPKGDIQFLGRMDDQVKLRGFRIELNEIEMVMQEFAGIKQAVVSLFSPENPKLVAYILHEEASNFNESNLKDHLRTCLPDFMVPNYFEIVHAFPLLSSGKVDRKNLPPPSHHIKQDRYIPPETQLEKQIATAWETALKTMPISIMDDFFYDLGGHSLLAATIVSQLRRIPGLQQVSILDIYRNPTIKQLALKFEKTRISTTHSEEIKIDRLKTSKWRYYACAVGQFFGCLLQYAFHSWQILAVILCASWASSSITFYSSDFVLIFVLFFSLMPIVSMAIVITSKWLLLGRVTPGKHRVWGWFYFRWWLFDRLQKNVFSPNHLMGTPLINLYYRLLGAHIGKNAFIASTHFSLYDLTTIGENASIGYDAHLVGYIIEDGWLKLGTIHVGKSCYVGARSVLSINTKMEDHSGLDELSMLPTNANIPEKLFYSGSPAKSTSVAASHIINKTRKDSHLTSIKTALFGVLHYLGMLGAMFVYYLSYFVGISFVTYFYVSDAPTLAVFLVTPIAAILVLASYLSSIIALKHLIMRKIKPGIYPIQSMYYFRQWFITKLLDVNEIYVMADSLYFPPFLRLLGAKIGKFVELGEVPHIMPDLVTIADQGFVASSVAIAWPTVHNGYIKFLPVSVGEKAFLGNMSLLRLGTEVGDGGLLGCMTVAPPDNRASENNTAWLGSPALFLPKREIFTGFTEQQIYKPTKKLYRTRLFIELIRITLPTTLAFLGLFGFLYSLTHLLNNYSLITVFLLVPCVELVIALTLVASIVATKWIMIGRLKPAVKPIWDIFIWKNDIIEYCYSYFISAHFTNLVLGTPFISLLLRAFGVRVGKYAVIDSPDFTEFDLIQIGDEVSINSGAVIQTHLYEDRIFKMSTINIGQGCNIGTSSIVLYNTIMESNTSLGNLSLLMKGERLPLETRWEGIPAQSIDTQYYQSALKINASELVSKIA